jgi:hypothetical protein
MKKILLLLFSVIININLYSQSCTSTVFYDNMETFTWFGDWFTPIATTGFFTNASVSSNTSGVIYGSGNGTSGLEQDWYSLPNITGLNPNYSYQLKFRLASYTFSNSTAVTRGLDVADYLSVQISTNGGITYTTELRITGNSNATWPFTSTGTITHTANGVFTNSAPPLGDVYQVPAGATTTAPSTITLNLPSNISQIAVDLYFRVNSAGEEFWIDNVELIEIITTPTISITGNNSICNGESTILTASGAQNYVWNNGITNGVSFIPSSTTSYSVTGTNVGMINGNGTTNTCSSTSSRTVTVKPIPNTPTLFRDTTICPESFTTILGSSNIGTIQWYDAPTNGNLLGTGTSYTTPILSNNTSYYAQSELNGCISPRSSVSVTMDLDCILPIFLYSFDGDNEGRTNKLNWITEQEINSSHFEIQRSKDGYTFESIGIVDATNSNPYIFFDENPSVGNNYYRLKMWDIDQTYNYSDIIVLYADYEIESKVYPNPFKDSITYTYYSETFEDLDILVFNVMGQLVYSEYKNCQTCSNIVNIDLNKLVSGTYKLVIKHKTSGYQLNQSIIKN